MKPVNKKNGNNRKMTYKRCARILKKHKHDLQERYKISEIGIFGSFVRGAQKKNSDIDIIVEFNEVPGLLRFIQIENHLCTILNHKVDLVHKKALKHQLRDTILNEVIYL